MPQPGPRPTDSTWIADDAEASRLACRALFDCSGESLPADAVGRHPATGYAPGGVGLYGRGTLLSGGNTVEGPSIDSIVTPAGPSTVIFIRERTAALAADYWGGDDGVTTSTRWSGTLPANDGRVYFAIGDTLVNFFDGGSGASDTVQMWGFSFGDAGMQIYRDGDLILQGPIVGRTAGNVPFRFGGVLPQLLYYLAIFDRQLSPVEMLLAYNDPWHPVLAASAPVLIRTAPPTLVLAAIAGGLAFGPATLAAQIVLPSAAPERMIGTGGAERVDGIGGADRMIGTGGTERT